MLDRKRLGKQRVETKQILNALAGQSKGWTNHPATRMWRGHEVELCRYGAAMCREWLTRGYEDSMLAWFEEQERAYLSDGRIDTPPAWLGDAHFHASHRSNLLRKDPEYYGRYCWPEPMDLPYVWPI
jgi:hypothetical protein